MQSSLATVGKVNNANHPLDNYILDDHSGYSSDSYHVYANEDKL